jgi:hypothetical protein
VAAASSSFLHPRARSAAPAGSLEASRRWQARWKLPDAAVLPRCAANRPSIPPLPRTIPVRLRREESDFLAVSNHEGEVLDFHSLRHTTGAWLAMAGAHPNAVKTVMRHSSITLTMDTYGHLFPGQEAETVGRFPSMLSQQLDEALRATGTDVEVETRGCNTSHSQAGAEDSPNLLQIEALDESMRPCAIRRTSTPVSVRLMVYGCPSIALRTAL